MTIQSFVRQGTAVRMPARFSLTTVALATTLAQAAFANDLQNEEVVVTATRTEVNARDVLADVTVIDREQIDSIAPGRSIGEVLQRFAGVQFNSTGGRGTSQGIYIRGAGNGYTLLMIDGVRYGSLTLGSPALENIPVELIERIEVLKGAASALYGSDAVGGVIQIFTKRGRDTSKSFTGQASVTAGENGHKSGNAGLYGAQNGFDYSLNISRVVDHGISMSNYKDAYNFNPDRDGFNQTAFTGSFGFKFNEAWRVDVNLMNTKGRVFSDTDPYANPFTDMKTEVAKMQLTGKLLQNWISKISIGESKDTSDNKGRGNDNSSYVTKQTEYKWDNEFNTALGTALVGAERLEQNIDPTDPWGTYNTKSRDINSIFIGLTGQYRGNSWQINLRNDDNSQFGRATTYGLTYGYELFSGLRVHASHGKSVKAPTFNQLYYKSYYGTGNPGLSSENGKSNEFGLAWQINSHDIKLTHFDNKITNLIQADSNNVQQNISGTTRLKGWTASYAWNHQNWHIAGIFDYLNTKKSDGKPLDRRAKHQFTLNIDKKIGKFRIGGSALHVGSRNDQDYSTWPSTPVKLARYTTLDLHAEYKLQKDWSVQARIANVTNKNYETAYGYNQLGRAGYLTLKWAPK